MYIVYVLYTYSGGRAASEKSNLTRPGEIVDLSIANDKNNNKKKIKNPPKTENDPIITATINNSAPVARAYIIIDAVCGSSAAGFGISAR